MTRLLPMENGAGAPPPPSARLCARGRVQYRHNGTAECTRITGGHKAVFHLLCGCGHALRPHRTDHHACIGSAHYKLYTSF